LNDTQWVENLSKSLKLGSDLVVLCIKQKSKPSSSLQGSQPAAYELSACPLEGPVCESLNRLIWYFDKEPATFLQLDEKRCRLDLNQSLPPANLQLSARL
jgi:hypothetical protein